MDSTGISSTVRGEWLLDVYHVKRGFVKLHALTDTETDAILSYALTDSGTTDGGIALLLIDAAAGLGHDIQKAFADVAYDNKNIWTGLMERKIDPMINLRASDTHANGCLYKGDMIDERDRLGAKAWKEKYGYGTRWRAECTFSDFKRMLGGFVRAKKLTRVAGELSCKIWIHNENKKYRGQ
ncbi:MAG: transposase [Methanomassiliicoccaceae archaeon]|nr:transposase [Methanomassiliicoccaceae archaeon]